MKKAALSIIMICYLAVSSGIVINFHYCMNRLASTELFATEGKQCVKCGMNMHKGKGCCHDEIKVIKWSGDQKVTAAIAFELHSFDAHALPPSVFIATPFYNARIAGDFRHHPPPLLTEQDTYLQNRVFRI